ncbi:hypothetical protein ACFDR9_001697 [Janthinobacterium sp. CG_23.3]|uniref:hypothetical protein n=1 Tax=unclassified Janthinobacterium TaxID=2610881 RepID=UPI0003469ECF|nr:MULTISPECIES: hypothetical protein [unclassified Janthinobacterium]MEC5160266.1 hypothetical protein [Janthinobacterium sp. CG_S6]
MSAKAILLIEDNAGDVGPAERALKNSDVTNPPVAGDGQEGLDYLFCEGVHGGRRGRLPPVRRRDGPARPILAGNQRKPERSLKR